MESPESRVFEVKEVTIEFSQEDPDSSDILSEANLASDAVSQTDAVVVGESPAVADAGFSQSLSLTTSLTAQNAVNVQKQLTIAHQANTNKELEHFMLPKRRGKNQAYAESLKTLTGIMMRFESIQK